MNTVSRPGRRPAGHLSVAAALLLLLVAAACSSTERVEVGGATEVTTDASDVVGADGTTSDGSVVGADAPTSAGGAKPASGPGATAAKGKGTNADGSTNTTAPGQSPGGAPKSSAGGPLEIGISYLNAEQALILLTAVGGDPTGLQVGDPKKQAQLVVDYVNSHGGIANRQIKPIYYEVDRSQQNQGQRMCAAFTEDNHVALMVVQSPEDGTIVQCAADHKTPLVLSGFDNSYIDQERFAKIGDYYYTTTNFLADRREKTYVDSLVSQGLLSKSSKVGLLTFDNPDIKRSVAKSLKPALAAHGITVADEVVYPDTIESPWPNYVLQFQTHDIDRVLFAAGGGSIVPILFMRAADNQGFRPQYGLASDNFLGFVASNVPKSQLEGARAIGWVPYADLSADFGATPAASSNNALCREIMTKGGEPPSAGFGLGYCDGLFFLKRTLDAAGQVSPAALAAAVAALGDSYTSVWHYGSRFGAGRHDGADVVRPAAFDGGCTCFRYTGPASRLP